ncbi:BZ3500_MvSof-1268-A1-R1_Chr7-3g09693 [Microbotryum saponariae]|uniref:BZ3500_MvSof-1268-A1-R1_Chr7-3g09693 protein n=1 Tax=Microbotryum saponariae TaxID=289078 RepID=A0A2X0MYY1_9BASI|nr:BZ3501_MvSof-1269-A2-R1_Chr7-2g09416 [Microbotryum saponariae]SDA02427.1 BZ3500_MvSof-1268-A1-R1_Chr7-3g09693 [Microbotryum saponariae]
MIGGERFDLNGASSLSLATHPTSRQRLKHAWSLAHRLRTEPTFSTSKIFWRRIGTSCGCYDPRAQEGRDSQVDPVKLALLGAQRWPQP